MKIPRVELAVLVAGALALGGATARADFEVGAGVQINAPTDFYGPLSSLGIWANVGSYGRCWRPAQVAPGWRPYCDGQWVWTDCGWYWESTEPWSWACYHYGRWFCDPAGLWCWAPDIQWAPGWVCWREGGGYIGWGPLGPNGAIQPPAGFVFVQAGHFQDPVRPSHVVVNDVGLFQKTSLINNIRRERRPIGGGAAREVFVNDGPGVKAIETETRKPVRQTSIVEAVRQTGAPVQLTRRNTRAPTIQAPATPHAVTPPANSQPKIEMRPQPGTQPGRSENQARMNRTPVTPPAPTQQPRSQGNLLPTPAPSSHTPAPLPQPRQRYYSPKDQFSPPAAQRSRPAPQQIQPSPARRAVPPQPPPQRGEREDRHEEKR